MANIDWLIGFCTICSISALGITTVNYFRLMKHINETEEKLDSIMKSANDIAESCNKLLK